MRLPVRLSLLLACAASCPLLLAAAFTLPSGREALRGQLEQAYAESAHALAADVERRLTDKLDALSLAASTLPLEPGLPRDRALRVVAEKLRGAGAVGLFDASGAQLTPPVRAGQEAQQPDGLAQASLSAFTSRVPTQAALESGRALSEVYVLPDEQGKPVPRVVLAVATPPARGKLRVLAAELSLQEISASFASFRPGDSGQAFLLDKDDKVILHPDPELMEQEASLADLPLVRGERSDEWLGAQARVPLAGWKTVVQEPSAEALEPLRRLWRDSLLWVGLGVAAAFALGFTAVRTVTSPVARLHEATLAIAGGSLEAQLEVSGKDELADLARAFNAMTLGLRQREPLKMILSLAEPAGAAETLQRLLAALGRAVRFDQATALLRSGEELNPAAVAGARTLEEARHLVPAFETVQSVLQSGTPALSASRRRLALPLLAQGTVLGVISLEREEPYSDDALQAGAALAQQAAIAVENARLSEEVQHLATSDPVTNLYSRGHFLELAGHQLSSARRFDLPLAAILLDVDQLRPINEKYGNATGDQVLRAVADRCRGTLRSIDLFGRYGGSELGLILPGTGLGPAGAVLGERLRKAVSSKPVATEAGELFVSISLGVSGLEQGPADLAGLLARAEESLRRSRPAARAS